MTRQTLKSKLRAGYTACLFILSLVCPAFFFVGAHYIGINDGASILCAISGLASAFLAGYCDNKIKLLR